MRSKQATEFAPAMHSPEDDFEAELRASRPPRHKDCVTRSRTCPADRPAAFNFSQNREIERHQRGMSGAPRCVTAGEPKAKTPGGPRQPAQHLVKPAAGTLRRQRQAQQEYSGSRAHCHDVARSTGKSLIADRAGSMNIDEEVDVLEELIAGKYPFAAAWP